jgi:hypothetical protein
MVNKHEFGPVPQQVWVVRLPVAVLNDDVEGKNLRCDGRSANGTRGSGGTKLKPTGALSLAKFKPRLRLTKSCATVGTPARNSGDKLTINGVGTLRPISRANNEQRSSDARPNSRASTPPLNLT